MVLGTLAIGQTLIILTAGIDLSCGTVMAFGSIVMTKMAVDNNVPPLLAILLGMLACAAFGLVNGGLVTRLGLPPFIVTLGTFYIAFALTHIYSNGQTITNLPSAMTWLGNTFKSAARRSPTARSCAVVVRDRLVRALPDAWGRRVYAIGDNPEATRLMGINVRWQLLCIYVVAGVVYGIAALLLISRTGVGDPTPARPTTWTRSPRWCWAARRCSAAAAP